jgi:hypothetical protein
MNSNGFTKRNFFIGDVNITENLECGDMICDEMTLTGPLNMDNKNIIGVNNLQVTTINNLTPGTGNFQNPTAVNLDMGNNDIKNCDNLQVTTINNLTPGTGNFVNPSAVDLDMGNNDIKSVSSIVFSNGVEIISSGLDLKLSGSVNFDFNNITNNIQITTLQQQTQYQSTSALTTQFSGILKSTTRLESPLIRLGTSPNQYDLPSIRGLSNQYLGSDGSNAIWVVLSPGVYGQLVRQSSTETSGYTMVANTLRSALNLTNTVTTSFLTSAEVTGNIAQGTLTYSGPVRVLNIEVSCKVRIGDNKQSSGLASLYLTINGTSVSNDFNRITDTNTRAYLNCKYIQPINTGSVISFSIAYDLAVTTNLFLSSISLSVNGYALA